MEENTIDTPIQSEPEIKVSEIQKSYFAEIGKWSKFMGILYAICFGIIAVLGVIFIILSSDIGEITEGLSAAIYGIILVVASVICIFPTIFLLKAAKGFKDGIKDCDTEKFEDGVKNTKSLYKFLGIYSIIALAFAGISIIVAIVAMIIAL